MNARGQMTGGRVGQRLFHERGHFLARPRQQAIGLAAQRIGLIIVGERHQVAEAGRPLDRRLAESLVELPAPLAGDERHQAIENPPPGLVQVEP